MRDTQAPVIPDVLSGSPKRRNRPWGDGARGRNRSIRGRAPGGQNVPPIWPPWAQPHERRAGILLYPRAPGVPEAVGGHRVLQEAQRAVRGRRVRQVRAARRRVQRVDALLGVGAAPVVFGQDAHGRVVPRAARRRGAGAAEAAVASTGASQLARAGRPPATCIVAIDMHDMPRYDGRPGEDVARGREYRGTTFFERCATAQCEEGGARVTLAFAPVGIHDGTAGIVRALVRDAAAACRAAGSEPVFVMDRGFQSVAVLRVLRGEGVRCAVPCRNTGRVVDALRERDAGLRGRVSRITMEGQDRTEEEITVAIVPRRRSRGGSAPESRLIAFAVSDPGVEVEKYDLRWGIETWYRELESARIRTSTHGAAARAMCLACSLLILNAWAVTNAMLADESSWRAATGAQYVPHAAFSHEVTLLAYGGRPRQEPPPEPILP